MQGHMLQKLCHYWGSFSEVINYCCWHSLSLNCQETNWLIWVRWFRFNKNKFREFRSFLLKYSNLLLTIISSSTVGFFSFVSVLWGTEKHQYQKDNNKNGDIFTASLLPRICNSVFRDLCMYLRIITWNWSHQELMLSLLVCIKTASLLGEKKKISF